VADVIPTLLRRTRQGKIKGKILRLFAYKSKPRVLFLQGGYTKSPSSALLYALQIIKPS
jgi:hypothetical protein